MVVAYERVDCILEIHQITFQHSNAKWKMYEPLLLTSRLAALRSTRQYNKHKKAARESLKVLKVE